MAGKNKRACVRTMTDVPKKKHQKVPSKEVEDDVEDRNKKKGNMSLGRKDGVIIESIYLTNIKGMTQICLAMGTKFLYK